MKPADQYRVLERYCAHHRCPDCPLNVVQLACGDPGDLCVLSLALNELTSQQKREVPR